VLAPHRAADGPLGRVRLPGGMLEAAQLRALGRVAAEQGDGHLELTSRANVQLRALAEPDVAAAELVGAGLLPSPAHERVRNILASPGAGRLACGVLDITPLVHSLDAALCARPGLAGLPGRFLFAIDDGSGDVADAGADVTLRACGPDVLALLLTGEDTGQRLAPDAAVRAAVNAAEAFCARRGTAWRIAELTGGVAPRTPPPPPPAGVLEQRDGQYALGVLAPLGRLSSSQVEALAGLGAVRVTPWRGLVLLDLAERQLDDALTAVDEVGLVSTAGSRWAGVSACAGRPRCTHAVADVRADAAATLGAPGQRAVHWVGCERRCGLPAGEPVLVEATGAGYEVDGVRAVNQQHLAELIAAARG
jgi:precorrin-3B synthase